MQLITEGQETPRGRRPQLAPSILNVDLVTVYRARCRQTTALEGLREPVQDPSFRDSMSEKNGAKVLTSYLLLGRIVARVLKTVGRNSLDQPVYKN